MLHPCYGINANGHLTVGGADTVALAKKYGTPLYVLDENAVIRNCRIYVNALKKYFGDGSYPLYAGKALCFVGLYSAIEKEGMGIDVVSCGEIYTAKAAGFPMEKAYFHGNNKTDSDIIMAMESGVGYFVADNAEEIDAIQKYAFSRGTKQKILIRVTPGIDPHTHKAVITGNIDSKFGAAIKTGQAMSLVKKALSCENIEFAGLHCHIGSQIFETKPFADAAEIMINFIADILAETGVKVKILNLGGGFGVKYTESHPDIDYDAEIFHLSEAIKSKCLSTGVSLPDIRLEPGRSIVAAAGVTLYTVGSVKTIPSYKTYISVDGGMPDNPRYALYQSKYTAYIADRMNKPCGLTATIAGRCCESGDLLAENIKIQCPERGDILAVLVTGAYNYSMASNYNRIPRPALVTVSDGADRLSVRRESFDDLIKNEIGL